MLEVHVKVSKHPCKLREDPVVLASVVFFVARVALLLLLALLYANPVGHHGKESQVIDRVLRYVSLRVEHQLRRKRQCKREELLLHLEAHTALIIA